MHFQSKSTKQREAAKKGSQYRASRETGLNFKTLGFKKYQLRKEAASGLFDINRGDACGTSAALIHIQTGAEIRSKTAMSRIWAVSLL